MTYGGYHFSEAQKEAAGDLSEEYLNKIGEIMNDGIAQQKRSYQIKQDLFNALGMDGEFFVRLHDAKGYAAHEEEIMHDYYLGFEDFTTKEEVYDFFNARPYLEKRPKLKQAVIEAVIELQIDEEEEEYQGKGIDIRDFTIHDDIKQLLWFGDGDLKNLTKEQLEQDKNVITLMKQFDPDDPRVAMSKKLAISIDEPSLIYTEKAVRQPQDGSMISDPLYSPAYKYLSPEQRWMYLKSLANPYDTHLNIGYVFILYYGLERHLLQGDFDAAFKVILKLRNVHTNKSFQKYSGNALILSAMLKNKGEYIPEFITSLGEEYQFSNNLLLMCYYSFNIPLLPKDIMRMAKTFGFNKTNYIKNYPDVFEQCLLEIIQEKTGLETIDIKKYVGNAELKDLRYEYTPIYINSSIMSNTVPVPMIADNFKLQEEMNTLLAAAHEATKGKLAEMRKAAKKTSASGKFSIIKETVIKDSIDQDTMPQEEIEEQVSETVNTSKHNPADLKQNGDRLESYQTDLFSMSSIDNNEILPNKYPNLWDKIPRGAGEKSEPPTGVKVGSAETPQGAEERSSDHQQRQKAFESASDQVKQEWAEAGREIRYSGDYYSRVRELYIKNCEELGVWAGDVFAGQPKPPTGEKPKPSNRVEVEQAEVPQEAEERSPLRQRQEKILESARAQVKQEWKVAGREDFLGKDYFLRIRELYLKHCAELGIKPDMDYAQDTYREFVPYQGAFPKFLKKGGTAQPNAELGGEKSEPLTDVKVGSAKTPQGVQEMSPKHKRWDAMDTAREQVNKEWAEAGRKVLQGRAYTLRFRELYLKRCAELGVDPDVNYAQDIYKDLEYLKN